MLCQAVFPMVLEGKSVFKTRLGSFLALPLNLLSGLGQIYHLHEAVTHLDPGLNQ